MSAIWDWVKGNPIIAGGAIFLFFVLVIILGSGTNVEEFDDRAVSGGQPDYSAAVAASHMLSQLTIQGQVASRVSDNDRAVKEGETNAAILLGKANFDYLSNKELLASKTAIRGFEADENIARTVGETTRYVSDNDRKAKEASYASATQIAAYQREVANNKALHDANLAVHLSNNAQYVRVREIDAMIHRNNLQAQTGGTVN